jgi:hypothetical protein
MATVKALNHNGFGLCDGHTVRYGVSDTPLTDWMERELRVLAGFPDSRRNPVCFRHLWGPDAAQQYRDALTADTGEAQLTRTALRHLRSLRKADCLVMTTDLSHRRPYHSRSTPPSSSGAPNAFASTSPTTSSRR